MDKFINVFKTTIRKIWLKEEINSKVFVIFEMWNRGEQ